MAKPDYSKENIRELKWHEHIRLRPGMYIGMVNIRGFITLLKDIFSSALYETNASILSIELFKNLKGKITVQNIKKLIVDNWGQVSRSTRRPLGLEWQVLNALSEKFTIRLFDKSNQEIHKEEFEKGILKNEASTQNVFQCAHIEVDFSLGRDIWGKELIWNYTYIDQQIREFAFLYKNVKFKLFYPVDKERSRIIYHFKNGLKDRINIEQLNGLGSSYFETHINEKIENFSLEIAFTFREYSVDEPFLRSFVNDYYTSENGTHIDGLLKGLTYGVMKYFQKHELTNVYKISEKGIKEHLVAAINIRIEAPVFSGCVKNKLANSEIIEPIANRVADVLFEKMEKEEQATEKLISKFRI